MGFEWDPEKAAANFQKHGVQFATEAVAAFDDDYAITIPDSESDPSEQRFILVAASIKSRPVGCGVHLSPGQYTDHFRTAGHPKRT